METKRRGFLGLFAGAAVLGPSSMMGAIDGPKAAFPTFAGQDSIRSGYKTIRGTPVDGKDFYKTQIEEARRYLRGELSDGERYDRDTAQLGRRRTIAESRVTCLRSVSDARKADMLLARHAAIDEEWRRRDKEWSITRWLKELEG